MGSLMDLVAGDKRDIVLALSIEDVAAFADPDRFTAHLSLSGALDATCLDAFAAATRDVTGRDEPVDFVDARSDLVGVKVATERIVERVDPGWLADVARIPDELLSALADRWIERLEEENGPLRSEEKLWVRHLAGRIVMFARAAEGARDVVFAWGF